MTYETNRLHSTGMIAYGSGPQEDSKAKRQNGSDALWAHMLWSRKLGLLTIA